MFTNRIKLKFLIYKKQENRINLCGEYFSLFEARKKLKQFVKECNLEEVVVLKTQLHIPKYLIAGLIVSAILLGWYLY